MKKILYFLLAIIFIVSCKDDNQDADSLPEATQSGKNTAGAIVNGKVWVAKIEQPSISGGNFTQYHIDPILGKYMLDIHLRNLNNPTGDEIKMYVVSNQEITNTSYQLIANTENEGVYINSASSLFTTKNSDLGILTITRFDKVNQIVSGTFTFKAIASNGEVINITEGRFDKKFQQ